MTNPFGQPSTNVTTTKPSNYCASSLSSGLSSNHTFFTVDERKRSNVSGPIPDGVVIENHTSSSARLAAESPKVDMSTGKKVLRGALRTRDLRGLTKRFELFYDASDDEGFTSDENDD